MFIAIALAALIVAVLGVWTIVGYVPTRGIEMPGYEVVEEQNGYEIRRYEPMIVAQVYIEGEYGESMNRGFGKLAGYIFDKNRAEEPSRPEVKSGKIPMTSPVFTEETGSGHNIAFVMPGDYSMETLPKPEDPDVKLREVPSGYFAVLRFGGYATDAKVHTKTHQLKEHIEHDGLETKDSPMLAQYNPPWTPPYMRRNEILIEVAWPRE
jgi:DNA gyrase inhibitor GyrI